MIDGLNMLHALGTWSVTAVWIPLLAWTLLAVLAYVAIQYRSDWHPLVRYRLLQALLLTLPLSLFVAAWADGSALLAGWSLFSDSSAAPEGAWLLLPREATSTAGDATAASRAWNVYHTIGLATSIAGLIAVGGIARLGWCRYAVARLQDPAEPASSERIQRVADTLARDLGIGRRVRVWLTEDAIVPLTFGTLRPIILVPHSLADDHDALRMTLTHELVHVRRLDFLARWTEQCIAAVFAIHPAVHRLVRAIESAREIACDTETLARLRCSPRGYASLLYSFSTTVPRHPAFAVSIAETSSSLKQRIRAMTNFSPTDSPSSLATLLIAAGLILSLGFGVVACSDAVTPPAAEAPATETATSQSETPQGGDDASVVVDDRPEIKGGMQALQQAIQYPELAKKAGIEGRVFVQFVVDENGDVVNPHVTRGVHEALDQAALNAVHSLSFEPGRHDGEAVKVKMALPVTFKLGNSAPEADATPIFEKAGMEQIAVSLRSNGAVTVDGQPATISDVADVVERKLAATDAKTYVALTVDRDTPADAINRVKASLHAAGVEHVASTSN